MGSPITVGPSTEGTISGKFPSIYSRKHDPCVSVSEVMNCESGKWYDCNDSWVKQISGHDAESSSAYVLFYVMKNGVKVTP
jgi:hypothetical protein